jgi:ferrochelatase
VLLTNVGSPEAPTAAAVRRYLRQFLGDRRVVDLPRLRWWLLLNLIILPIRAPRSAGLYRKIWTEQGSPLVVTTRAQSRALQTVLDQRHPSSFSVAMAMRYGEPSIGASLAELDALGCRRILVFPLYPQYSATTTATVADEVSRILGAWQHLPELRMVHDYHEAPGYIGALAASVTESWQRSGRGERLLISCHGLPQRYADAGDPYPERCQVTAQLLARALDLEPSEWFLAYQSRFGREPWLEPATVHTLESWAHEGVASVDVVCPGFAADCLETLEEIAIGARERFERAGGERLRYVPALNERSDHIRVLADLVVDGTRGWMRHRETGKIGHRSRSQPLSP